MSRTWSNQFPPGFGPSDRVLKWLAGQSDFTDSSWGNDLCPSFTAELKEISPDTTLVLWVDHEDPARREREHPRYAVVIYPQGAGEPGIPVLETDDVEMALAAAEWTVRMVRTVYRDLQDLLATGDLPRTIGSYSKVHDFCDANVLGDFEEGCEYFSRKFGHLNTEASGREWDACRDLFFGICGAVHRLMDWWIRNRLKGGGP